MNQMGDSSRRKSRSPDESYAKRSILSNIDKSQLSTLKVTIKKRGVIATAPNLPLERSIDDYAKICSYVHVRKGVPPRVPVFGGDIKVDQNFGSSRTVYYYDSGQGTSNSVTESDVMDERNRIRDRSRRRSKSNSSERYRRSLSKPKNTRSDSRRYRSRSRERRYSSERRNHRGRSSRSRSRSVSRHRNRSITPSRRSSRNRSRSVSRHRHRSITPLRPGEYRPGHPDLALRKEKRRVRVSYSRSPSKSRGSRADSSMSKERLSSERSVSRRRSRSRRRSPVIPPPRMMPGMEYGYYGGYPPFGMPPYSPRLPMMGPNFYRMPFHNGMMAPRMFNRMMPIREPRLPVYNQVISKPATVTSKSEADSAQSITVEQLTNVSTETNEAVLSAGITDDQEKNTVTEELKS